MAGSVRDYAILWIGARRSVTGSGATAFGGNALLETPQHKLDGPEHLEADDTTVLDATVDHHGLMAKLSGDSGDTWHGDGTWGPEPSVADFATPAIVLGTAADEGVSVFIIRADATIEAFDATLPAPVIVGAGGTGASGHAARRDHDHPFTPPPMPNALVESDGLGGYQFVFEADGSLIWDV